MSSSGFHGLFVAGFLLLLSVRLACSRAAFRSRGKVVFMEGGRNRVVRRVMGLTLVGTAIVYVFSPSTFDFAAVPFPAWVRWLGAAMLFTATPLLGWVHASLGANFSSTLHLREEHTLVTHGPYRWVRHPMYTVGFMALLGALLLTGNVLIGGLPLLVFSVIVAMRRPREEALMLKEFGEQYRDYMERTGRFVPRVFGTRTA